MADPGPGYYKFTCKNYYTYNCGNWVWVNGSLCAACVAAGRDNLEITDHGASIHYGHEDFTASIDNITLPILDTVSAAIAPHSRHAPDFEPDVPQPKLPPAHRMLRF